LSIRAREWMPGGGLAASNETTVRREIDAALAAYAGLKRKHKGRKATATLKVFRDKKIAHSLIDVR
jgi:hypothetical protein